MALSTIRITGFFVLLAAVVSGGDGLSSFLPTEAYSNDRPIQASEQPPGFQAPAEATGTDRAFSKAVRVNGTEFRAVVQSRLRIPAPGEERDLKFGLLVRNTSDKSVVIANAIRFTVTAANGKHLLFSDSGKEENPHSWFRVIGRGEELVCSASASLEWAPDGQVLRLTGCNGTDTGWWFDGLGPGEYFLSAEYESKSVGKVKTEPVRFTIVPTLAGLKRSKPVRVNGVDFQAVVEPRQGPLQDRMQPIIFGLSITNRTGRPFLFNMFDTREIGLRNAAGQDIHCSYEREETDYTGPVLVGPGKTETVLYDASIWPGDGNTLEMFTHESGGTWAILGLVPGKYSLRFGYGNSLKALKSFFPSPPRPKEIKSYWYGDVETEEVEFEITPPGPAQPNRIQNK